ncbi:23S rRNA (pseudouridine(1915)-N(3))-methyltransferase RlmH [Acidobacteria bacterium AH-259-A15]|nr:23S rRNA (pseudouridine(1915)-N(3))-methyltransferase RlmH [Acidobacteria bacterium AH-259-A15]
MRLRFLWIGKTKDPLLLKVEERYLKRIEQYFPTERATVRDLKKIDRHQQAAQLEREARQIERKLSSETYLVVLDSLGKQFTSQRLASFVAELMNRAVSEVTFVVGGHLGIPSKIKDLADLKISLTKLTLPHELARIILLEQIYRAVSVIKGLPYHK